MTLREKLDDLRKTPSLAPTAAEYRALLDLAAAVEARPWIGRDISGDNDDAELSCEGCGANPVAERIAHLTGCPFWLIDAALARLKETMK